jgi:hypothetical protein
MLDGQPSILISDWSETNEGAGNWPFVVSLSAPSSQVVTVDFTTADGTAVEFQDYEPVSGTLTFQPQQTTAVIPLTTFSDTRKELNETFYIRLSNPQGADLPDPDGTILINDSWLPSETVYATIEGPLTIYCDCG